MSFVKRASGLVEAVCVHGIGHPDPQFMYDNPSYGKQGFGLHGCDGCCRQWYERMKVRKRAIKKFSAERKSAKMTLMKIDSYVPSKWRFVDLETRQVWEWKNGTYVESKIPDWFEQEKSDG